MKVFFHLCSMGFSNCYILGTDNGIDTNRTPQALIIDPGCMDIAILDIIEKNNYQVVGILITHDHDSHVAGLKTLKKIYDAPIYAGDPTVCEEGANIIHDGDSFKLGFFEVEVFNIPGHTSDSMVYKIDRLLFTGDVLTAGLIGSTQSDYGRSVQNTMIRSKILSLPGNLTIFPGHGPPTSLETERQFNIGLEEAEKAGQRRASMLRDFW